MSFELSSGLPEGQWQIHPKYDSAIAIPHGDGFRIIAHVERFDPPEQWKAVARAIASIPDLVEEIERLRERVANLESGLRGFESDCIELAAECEDADISPAERRTYRAFAASARAILAKTQEAAP